MISLEHIRTLESKVNKAVATLAALQEENLQLKSKLAQSKTRIEELEFAIEEYREDQSEIEQGIMQALQHLDHLESAVGGLKVPSEAAPAAQVKPEALAAPVAPAPEVPPAPVEAAEPEETLSSAPAEAAESATHWEVPIQQFQPAPLPQEEYEPVDPPVETEAAPVREQQLDIF